MSAAVRRLTLALLSAAALGARINTGPKASGASLQKDGDWIFGFRAVNHADYRLPGAAVKIHVPGWKTQWCHGDAWGLVCLKIPAHATTVKVEATADWLNCSPYVKTLERSAQCSNPNNCLLKGSLSGFGNDCAVSGTMRRPDADDKSHCEGFLNGPHYSYGCTDTAPAVEHKSVNFGGRPAPAPAPVVMQEGCAEFVTFMEGGLESDKFGVFKQHAANPFFGHMDGHPLYKNAVTNQWLYYHKNHGAWLISGNFNDGDSAVMSEKATARCPDAAKWSSMTIIKGLTTTPTTTTTTTTTTPAPTPPPTPAPTPAPTLPPPTPVPTDEPTQAGTLQGSWTRGTLQAGTLQRCSISGTTLTWLSGGTTALELITPAKCRMTYDGNIYTAEVGTDGDLHWSDGDVWKRVVKAPDATPKPPAGDKAQGGGASSIHCALSVFMAAALGTVHGA